MTLVHILRNNFFVVFMKYETEIRHNYENCTIRLNIPRNDFTK